MSSHRKALSVRTIRAIAKRSSKGDSGLEAALAASAWLFPIQLVTLFSVGAPFATAISLTVAASLGLMVATPFVSGVLYAANVPRPDSVGWLAMAGAAATFLNSFVGWVPAAVELVLGTLVFGYYLRRNIVAKNERAEVRGLPAALVQRVVALPKQLAGGIREPLDRALAAHGSLIELLGPPGATRVAFDERALAADAVACVREVIDRAEAAMRLDAISTRTPKVEAAQASLVRQISALVDTLTAAVDAAATYIAVGEADAAAELAARAEHLHDVAQSLAELDRELAD